MKEFKSKILLKTRILNILVSILIFVYSGFIVKLPAHFIVISGILIIGFLIIGQFIFTHLVLFSFFNDIRLDFIKEDENKLTINQRTLLLKKVLSFPKHHSLNIFSLFCTFSIFVFCFYFFYIKIILLNCLIAFFACILISFTASLFTLDILERYCSKQAEKIVKKGIAIDQFSDKNFEGTSIYSWHMLYIVIPAIMTNCFSFILLLDKYIKVESVSKSISFTEMINMGVIVGFNTILTVLLCIIVYKRIFNYESTMTKTLHMLIKKDVLTTELIPTDFSTEFSFNMYLINNIIMYFRNIYKQNNETGSEIFSSAKDLVLNSSQTSTVAIQQASGINEILKVMENSEKSSKNVASETEAMSERAKKSVAIIQESFKQLTINLQKMQEITESNIETITGIKKLGEKINSVWEIVTLIEHIAEQTNIIAFNAELESSVSGETGKKFHIVANEIHRLASNTSDSVNEIKKLITAIQHASDNLIISSESGTEKIRKGCDLSVSLETKFQSISSSSEITAESANEIAEIVNQQNSAFEQIVMTIRQLATGVGSFTESTTTISAAAKELEKIAEQLTHTLTQENIENSVQE